MRDVLITLANEPPHPRLLRLRVGEWESFVDLRGRMAVQFTDRGDRLVARVLVSRGARLNTLLFTGGGLPGLRDTLRQAAG